MGDNGYLDGFKNAETTIWALREALALSKENIRFAPIELNKAITVLAEAERNIKITISKLK